MNRKQPLLLALSAAMVIGTSAPAFAAEATDAATREDVISLLWQQEGAPVINYALPFTDVADTAADAVRWAAEAKIVSITSMFRTSLVPACISRSGFIENSRLAPAFRISSLSICLSIIRRIAGSRPSGVTPGANRTYPR